MLPHSTIYDFKDFFNQIQKYILNPKEGKSLQHTNLINNQQFSFICNYCSTILYPVWIVGLQYVVLLFFFFSGIAFDLIVPPCFFLNFFCRLLMWLNLSTKYISV